MIRMMRDENGSMVLEAALVLPLLLAFVIALATMTRVSVADAALEAAVSETTKQVATHMYPIDLLVKQFQNSHSGHTIVQFIEQLKQARQLAQDADRVIDQYSFLIPEPLLELIRWVQAGGTKLEGDAEKAWNEALNVAFKQILLEYVDRNEQGERILDSGRIRVIQVNLPDISGGGSAYFSLEAEYAYPINIPFIHKTVHIRKKAVERVWIGD